MFRNYLKTAWRNLLRHKTDSTINVVGLCVAFTSALLLFLSVYYEFSYDRFHKNGKHLYHLYFTTFRASQTEVNSSMPYPLLDALQRAYPEVKHGSKWATSNTFIKYKDKTISKNIAFADPDFFRMFSFPLAKGDTSTALKGSNTVVLRDAVAKAVFGNEEPMGKLVQIKVHNQWQSFIVCGVGGAYPDNSSLNYDVVVPFRQFEDYSNEQEASWSNRFLDIFIQLDEHSSKEDFEKKLPAFVKQHMAESINHLQRDGARPDKNGNVLTLNLQPFLGVHTETTLSNIGNAISKSYLYLLLVVGVLIVVIACINFVNLSIGRSFTRSREIGLRKTLGARQKHIALQLWGEALLICGIAFAFSCLFTCLLLPGYKQLFGLSMQKQLLQNPLTWLSALAVFVVITLIAGAYPAWVMGRLQIVNILKGKITAGSNHSSKRLRNGLIVMQFAIAIFLITCTLISWKQVEHLRTQPLGFNTTQVISIPVTAEMPSGKALQLMRQKLAAYPDVLSITGIYNNLGQGQDGSSMYSVMGFDYKNREIRSHWYGVSYDFVKTLDLQIVAGRDFSPAFLTDSSGVVINEAMANELGDKNPVGEFIPTDDGKLKILGIVKNFNFQSLHNKIEPLTLVLNKAFDINYILVKVKPVNAAGSMDLLRKAWKEISPGSEFLGSFLDENVNRQYQQEEKLRKIFITGATIAIVLSCMGLLAMVILIVSQRVKEIGIRKVLGASAVSIVQLLAKEFVLLVLLAAMVAFPVAWYFMHRWLQDFAYRITISWWLFAIAGVLAIAIAFVTISLQTFKAALRNPVKSLRTE